MADPDRSTLDEARKRARRRLVGAVVLALIAAVVLPIFLETEPKPLGPDVQIQIPPIDDSKFQNRLTPEPKAPKGADAAKTQPPPAESSPKGSVPAAPAPSVAPTPSVPGDTAKQDAKPAAAAAPESAKKAEVAAKQDPKPAPAEPAMKPGMAEPAMKSATAAPASPPAPPAAAEAARPANPKNGAFVVQLGAFVGVPIAAELADKARAQGFPVFLEQITTKGGPVHRVRVGPYATRADAQADAVKLKLAGYAADVRPR